MNCPLGFNCTEMELNSGGFCVNKGKCCAIASTLHDEEHPDPDAMDALDDTNPYLSSNWYERGASSYWEVVPKKSLPFGYAVAQSARLPCAVVYGVIEVVASDRGYAPAVRNPNFFLEIDFSPIVLIEWCDGELRQIYTQNYQYWCNERKDGHLLCSNDGGKSIEFDYWQADIHNPWKMSFYGSPTKVELTHTRIEALRPRLENVIICEEQFYCQVCQDYVYEDAYGSCNCNHIHYVDWLGCWGGCGYAEEDLSEDYKNAIAKMNPSVRNYLKKLLEAKDISGLWNSKHWALEQELCGDELDAAVIWIKSLDDDTPDAIAQTLTWLEAIA